MVQIDAYYHSKSSARKWCGSPSNYHELHQFIDSSKEVIGDVRHRAMYHHTSGVVLCMKVFGVTLDIPRQSSSGFIQVPTKQVAELHLIEDLGWLPTFADYVGGLPIRPWMSGSRKREIKGLSILGIPDGEKTA